MARMTPFRYAGFWDVPRCLSIQYRGRQFLLLSDFDDDMDEYSDEYSIYEVDLLSDDAQPICTPDFPGNTHFACIGKVSVDQVHFDPSMRKELDASILDRLIDG